MAGASGVGQDVPRAIVLGLSNRIFLPRPRSAMNRLLLHSLLLCAVPVPARAMPPQRIPVLIATGENDTDWRWTSTWLQSVLRQSGRFDVTVSLYPDGDLADPSYLSGFRAVVLDYAGRRWGDTAEGRFVRAVEEGLGVVAVGSAATAFGDWDEYAAMLGLSAMEAAGGDRYESFDISIVDGSHPLTRDMGAWSGHRDALPSGLALLDGTPMQLLAGASNEDTTVPALLAGLRGKGRVVTTPLGRVRVGDDSTWAAQEDPQFQQLVIRAVEWAATGAVTPLRRLAPNTLSEADRAAGWRLIFDGSSTSGWRSMDGSGPPADVWGVEAGCLRLMPGSDASTDIVHEELFDAERRSEGSLSHRVPPPRRGAGAGRGPAPARNRPIPAMDPGQGQIVGPMGRTLPPECIRIGCTPIGPGAPC